MRIGVIGTGAMASIFGGGLIEAGHDVVFVGKNSATVAALNDHGLTVDRDGASSSHHAASAFMAGMAGMAGAASAGICDIVLVLVKSYDTAEAVGSIDSMVGPESIIVTLQNGVGAAEMIAAAFSQGSRPSSGSRTATSAGSLQIVQGVTYQGGTVLGPGHVYHHSTATTVFGPFQGTTMAAAKKLATLWIEAGWKASFTLDIEAEVWKKVVVNGVNAIAATTLLPSRAMTESPAVRQLVADVVLEGMTVAHALGYTQLDQKQAVADILRVLAETPDGRTSMLQDIDAGRRTEIDVLNGAVIEAAERVGIDVPVNRSLFAQVTAWEVARGLRTP